MQGLEMRREGAGQGGGVNKDDELMADVTATQQNCDALMRSGGEAGKKSTVEGMQIAIDEHLDHVNPVSTSLPYQIIVKEGVQFFQASI